MLAGLEQRPHHSGEREIKNKEENEAGTQQPTRRAGHLGVVGKAAAGVPVHGRVERLGHVTKVSKVSLVHHVQQLERRGHIVLL